MEEFNVFETGGRKKFLEKNKKKKVLNQDQAKIQRQAIKIQNQIRYFIQYRRFHAKQCNKMQIENQNNHSINSRVIQELQEYWMLTPYSIRNYQLLPKILKFWTDLRNGEFEEYSINHVKTKMIMLSIHFLQEISQIWKKQSVQICAQIIQQYIQGRIITLSNEYLKTLLFFLKKQPEQIVQEEQMKRNQQQHPDMQNQAKQNLFKRLFRYLLKSDCKIQHKQITTFTQSVEQSLISLFQSSFVFFIELLNDWNEIINEGPDKSPRVKFIIKYYPKIIQDSQPNFICENLVTNYSYKVFQSLYSSLVCEILQNSMFEEIKQQSPAQFQTVLAFLNCLLQTIKKHTEQGILKRAKIDPKIFGVDQREYMQYLNDTQEWHQYQEWAMLFSFEHYNLSQQNASFVTKCYMSILKQYQEEAKFNRLRNKLRRESIVYILELISLLKQGMYVGISIHKFIQLLVSSLKESNIYRLGREQSSMISFSKNSQEEQLNFISQQMIACQIILGNKVCEDTHDLNFVKQFQSSEARQQLRKACKDVLLKLLKHLIFLPHRTNSLDKITASTITLLGNLYQKIFRTKILPIDIFQNASFIFKLKNCTLQDYRTHSQISTFLEYFPFVIPLNIRARILRQYLNRDRLINSNAHHFWDQDDSHSHQVKIRRDRQFEDAFNALKKSNLKKYLKIVFINKHGFTQSGIDAGGLKKQFLNRVLKTALTPDYGLFIENQNHELLPHPTKAQLQEGIQAEYYQFIGKLIGLAIYENITLGFKFSGTFLNTIFGKKNNFDDLKTIDSDLYRSLAYIKDMKEDARELQMTFLFKDQKRNKHILLKPHGNKIKVTNQNKRQYIYMIANYKVNRCLQHQSKFIRKGLTSMIDRSQMFMFNYEELSKIISGTGNIDIIDLKMHTKLVGYKSTDETIKSFWATVCQFDQDQKSKLLMFVTACPRPSFLGFKEMNPHFTIMKQNVDTSNLPISHTCSNVLQLPDYKDKQTLKSKLLKAIESNSGFQFG